MAELIILVVLGTSIWVLIDARHIGVKKGRIAGVFNMGPVGWFFSCLLTWGLAAVLYLMKRSDYKNSVRTSSAPDGTPTATPTAMSLDIVLHGNQGKTLTVSGDNVRIVKQSSLTSKRERSIFIRNVTSVEVKKPGDFVVGFIQFSIAGGKARDSSYTLTGGSFDAVQDENSVVFTGQEKYEIALKIKAYVENWSGSEPQAPPAKPSGAGSVVDEIRKLRALVDEGLLTTEEFEQQKKKLLAT